MKHIDYKRHLLLCGIIFTIHNIEEAIGYAYFTLPAGSKLPVSLPAPRQMIGAIVAITLIAWIIFLWAIKTGKIHIQRDVLTVASLVFAINAIFPHIASAIVLRDYTPAVATSVLLYLPYSSILLPKLFRSYQPRKDFYKTGLIGIAMVGLLTVFLQFIMKIIIK